LKNWCDEREVLGLLCVQFTTIICIKLGGIYSRVSVYVFCSVFVGGDIEINWLRREVSYLGLTDRLQY